MRKAKILSLFLSAVMLLSCVSVALFVGVSAEGETTAPAVSYSDPRDSASKVYYARVNSTVTTQEAVQAYATANGVEYNVENELGYGNTFWGPLGSSSAIRDKEYEPGSVLVLFLSGTARGVTDGNNTLHKKSLDVVFGATTLFRTDGTKLPIVVEGIDDNRAATIEFNTTDKSYTVSRIAFANDYYFTNLTLQSTNTTYARRFFAGSGNVIFDNVTFNFAGNAWVYADNWSGDAFYGWTEDKFNANKDPIDNKLKTSFTFGENTTFSSINKIAATGGASTAELQNISNYLATFVATTDAFSAENVEDIETKAAALKYLKGNGLLTESVVLPSETKTEIVIDTGTPSSTTNEYSSVYVRTGYSPVANAQVTLKSGNINSIYLDKNDGVSAASEIYVGDTSVTVNGGRINNYIYGLNYSIIDGDVNINVGGGYIKRIDGVQIADRTRTGLVGDFNFNMTDGEINEVYGGANTFGSEENQVVNTFTGGMISNFVATRYGTRSIVNDVKGGEFNTFNAGGATGNGMDIGSIDTTFDGNVRINTTLNTVGGKSNSCTIGTVTTTIKSLELCGAVGKLTNTPESHALNVEGDVNDVIFLNSSNSYTFDNFKMDGTLKFNNTIVTGKNAEGSFNLEKTTACIAGKPYFTFTPAAGKTVSPALTGGVAGGTSFVEGGKTIVAGAVTQFNTSLLLDQRIKVRFYLDKAVYSLVKADLTAKLGNSGLALTPIDEQFCFETSAIGLGDYTTEINLFSKYFVNGKFATPFTVKGFADAMAESGKTDAWKDWGKALSGLIDKYDDSTAANHSEPNPYGHNFSASRKENIITNAKVALIMDNAVGIRVRLVGTGLPDTATVTVNGNEIPGAYTVEGDAFITLFFAPTGMKSSFDLAVTDGGEGIFTMTNASVAYFAYELDSVAGDALLDYINATAVVAEAEANA